MSTNYYILTKDKSIIEKYGLTYELTDSPDWGYKVHIAKRSHGWKPLFQGHKNINSIDDIYKLINESTVTILDEYDRIQTVEEFEKEVIEWFKDDKEALSHIEEEEKDRFKNAGRSYWYLDSSKLWTDDKGYEFMSLDFS